jgi:hypothetical protein
MLAMAGVVARLLDLASAPGHTGSNQHRSHEAGTTMRLLSSQFEFTTIAPFPAPGNVPVRG